MDIEQKLADLKIARETVSHIKSGKAAMIEAVKTSEVYLSMDEVEKNAASAVEILEVEIRAMGLGEYQATGNKKPHPKVAVKIFKWFRVLDLEKVRDWAFGNLPAALKLDEKKVEKYALEFGAVDGTESGEEPRVQIATDL